MRKSQFSEEQIIAIMKEAGAGAGSRRRSDAQSRYRVVRRNDQKIEPEVNPYRHTGSAERHGGRHA